MEISARNLIVIHKNLRISTSHFLISTLDVGPCDISVDWCGWKSVGGWKRVKYQELDQEYQDHDGADRGDNDDENYKGDTAGSVGRGRLYCDVQ